MIKYTTTVETDQAHHLDTVASYSPGVLEYIEHFRDNGTSLVTISFETVTDFVKFQEEYSRVGNHLELLIEIKDDSIAELLDEMKELLTTLLQKDKE